MNKTALKTHGLDSKGQLYKVNFFEFYREEDVIKTTDDPGYNQEAFEERLEIKGDSDHTKLIHMLDAVNDYSIPINQVLEQYFDEEISYIGWRPDSDWKCGHSEPEYVSVTVLRIQIHGILSTGTMMDFSCDRNTGSAAGPTREAGSVESVITGEMYCSRDV